MLNLDRRLTENIISLFTLKGAEYIISFITLPFLLRVIGPEKIGAIAFAQVLINYANLFVDYGFNLTAPRDIAKSDTRDIPKHFSAIFIAKFLLIFPVISIGCIGCILFHNFLDLFLILCVLPALIGNVVFPVWYFQGVQKMRFITIFNLIARSISVVCIFFFIRGVGDYYLAAFLQSITPLIAGIISMYLLFHRQRELFCMPSKNDIKLKFKDGWDIFISTVFINFYTNSSIFILRIMTNDTCVGYYAAANKLIEAAKGLMTPISNAIFPHVSLLYKESRERAISFLCKALRIIGSVNFLGSCFIFIFAEPIVHIIMGNAYTESILILRILSFLPFIIGLSNVFGIQTMVVFGMQRLFSRILMISAVLNFVLIFPFIHFWEAIGLSITVVIVECFVTITMYVMLRLKKIILK